MIQQELEKWGRFLKKKDDNIFVLDKEMAGENKKNVKAVDRLTDWLEGSCNGLIWQNLTLR